MAGGETTGAGGGADAPGLTGWSAVAQLPQKRLPSGLAVPQAGQTSGIYAPTFPSATASVRASRTDAGTALRAIPQEGQNPAPMMSARQFGHVV